MQPASLERHETESTGGSVPSKKALAEQLIETVKHAQEEDAMFLRADMGDVIAMALGIKPMAWLTSPIRDTRTVTDTLILSGIDGYAMRNGMIVNRTLVRRRLNEQFHLATQLGWDERLTLDGNLSLVTNPDEPNRTLGLTGFLLGFPEISIQGYLKKKTLRDRGIPSVQDILSAGLYPELAKKIGADEWDRVDQGMLSRFAKAERAKSQSLENTPVEMQARLASEVKAQLFERFADEIAHILKNYYGTTDEEISFLLSIRTLHLTTEEGFSVYSFNVFGENGDRNPDVQALKRIVYKALKRSGFNPTFAGFSTHSV